MGVGFMRWLGAFAPAPVGVNGREKLFGAVGALLGRQLDTTKLATGLPRDAMFYHKTGWWSMYTNDVGFVKTDRVQYVIALFTPVWEERARPRMKVVAEKVQALIENRHRR